MAKCTRLGATVTVGLFLLLADPLAEACGDKLLSIARGMRLQNAYKTRHPASILVYVGRAAGAKTQKGQADPLVQMSLLYMSLKQAGHKPQAVGNAADLNQALTATHFDFVVADLTDIAVVTERVSTMRSKPMVLPVIYKPSKSDFAAAQKQFEAVLKAPATSTQHLETIERAMKSRVLVASGP